MEHTHRLSIKFIGLKPLETNASSMKIDVSFEREDIDYFIIVEVGSSGIISQAIR
jgi:hypothetical protein